MKNGNITIKINLLPPELKRRKKVPFIDRTLIYVVFSIILLIVLLVFVNFTQKTRISELESQIKVTEAEIKRYQPLLEAIKQAKTLKSKIQERINAIQTLEVERPLWVNTLREFTAVLPNNLWYNTIKYNSSTSIIELQGQSYSLNDIAQYLINLDKSAYFTGVSLKGISKKSDKKKNESYEFSLRMTLLRDQTKAEVGEFKIKKEKKKEKNKTDLKKVDLEPKGREELGKEKEKARGSIKKLGN
ncbi:MAG: PilN domain-containing protein [Candidatus Zixiibacteriota bacterium]